MEQTLEDQIRSIWSSRPEGFKDEKRIRLHPWSLGELL